MAACKIAIDVESAVGFSLIRLADFLNAERATALEIALADSARDQDQPLVRCKPRSAALKFDVVVSHSKRRVLRPIEWFDVPVEIDDKHAVSHGSIGKRQWRPSQAKRRYSRMQVDKEQVLDFLRKEGKNEYVQKAIQELPQKIDHEQHAQMLQQKFGIDPGKLAEKAIENQVGVASPSDKPTPARPASTGASVSNERTNAPASTASPSDRPATAPPANEPADAPSASNEPADAPAPSAGNVDDVRPPA